LIAAARALSLGGQVVSILSDFGDESSPSARACRLYNASVALCRSHGFDVRCRGLLPGGPVVIVANHMSWVDCLVMTSLAPCMPIAKGEIDSWPFLGPAIRSLGVAFVRRGDAHSGARVLRQALRALESGVSVLGFPEGTTSDRELLPFRRGMFGLAQLAGAPIVPAALSYADTRVAWIGDDSWFVPHYFRTVSRPRTTVHIQLGRAIQPTLALRPEELAHTARSRIAELLRRKLA
jgi:1-acyl-sn-glycerol-3-phosphate acyltransferase